MKHVKLLLITLTTLFAYQAIASEFEAYLTRSEDGSVIKFYYDANRATHENSYSYQSIPWFFSDGLKEVIFDESFANYPVENFGFSRCQDLIKVVGLENLKTKYVSFRECTSLTSIDLSKLDLSAVESMAYMFSACKNLKSVNISQNFESSKVTDMREMFEGCHSLTHVNLSGLNTKNVKFMNRMFYDCSSLVNLDLGSFNTENVTDMGYMFFGCYALKSLNIGNFNTANVSNMEGMFYNCSSLTNIDVSNFNTGNAIDLSSMFSNCSSLTSLDLSNFNTEKVAYMSGMFSDCSLLKIIDISGFSSTSIKSGYLSGMFKNCSSLITVYASDAWNWKGDATLSKAFEGCIKLMGGMGTAYGSAHNQYAKIDEGYEGPGYFTDKKQKSKPQPYAVLSNDEKSLTFYFDEQKETRAGVVAFQTSDNNCYPSITTVAFDGSFAEFEPYTTAFWFFNCKDLTTFTGMENLSTESIRNAGHMFRNCSSLTMLDLSNWHAWRMKDARCMFQNCTSLKTIYVSDKWSLVNAPNSNNTFSDCISIVGGKGTVYNSKMTGSKYARIDGGTDKPGYLTDINADKEQTGDLSGDGVVNATDLVMQTNMILTNQYNSAADLNGDGVVNATDYVIMVNKILNKSE